MSWDFVERERERNISEISFRMFDIQVKKANDDWNYLTEEQKNKEAEKLKAQADEVMKKIDLSLSRVPADDFKVCAKCKEWTDIKDPCCGPEHIKE